MNYTVEVIDVYPSDESTMEIPDDAEILAAEWRGPNRLAVAVATPVEVSTEHGDEWACATCGDTFDTEHGLKIHRGSAH